MSPPLARRLPIPVPPAAAETVASYLRRLAGVNRIPVADLEQVLLAQPPTASTTRQRLDPARLSALTGYAVSRLQQAVPELGHAQPSPPVFQHQPQPACRRCTSGHPGLVVRFVAQHRRVCSKHRVWLAPRRSGSLTHPVEQVDLSGVPEVLAAATGHRRLVARHGAAATHRAVTRAQGWLDQQRRHPEALCPHWRRLAILRPGHTRVHTDEAAYQAATYPEIVQASQLLLIPHWQALAAAEHTRPAFFAAAGRLIGWPHEQRWHPEHTNPLHIWAHQQASHPDPGQEARDFPHAGLCAPARPWALG